MRLNHLLALATVAGATAATAHAQVTISRAPTATVYRYSSDEPSNRAAIGIGTGMTGTLRDTLGVLITSITRGGPAEKAGLEEGNRIAAINNVSLRANAADIEDSDMSNALTRRLTRELAKSKPGDEVELRVYREGRMQDIKLKTTDADSLFRPAGTRAMATKADAENRPTLGISIGSTGSRRDTLGVLVMSVADSSTASRAGIEEGNRIAAINGINLRVAHEDAGDRYLSSAKAQRLQREVSQLKVGDNATLRVYSNGQFRDVPVKVGRAGDLPKGQGGMTFIGGDGFFSGRMAPMPAMPVMPRMAPMPPMGRSWMEIDDDAERAMVDAKLQLERIAPELREKMNDLRPELDRMRLELNQQLRPSMDKLRTELQMLPLRARIRTVNVIV